MKIILVPKDSCNNPLVLNDVQCWYHSHGAFTFVKTDGTIRVYPDCQVWRIEIPRQ